MSNTTLEQKKSTTQVQTPPPHMKGIMVQMVLNRCLSIAAELGIADFVAAGTTSIKNLASLSKSSEDALYRILRVLAAHDIFKINADKSISNSEISEYLRSDKEGSQRNFARMMASPWMWKAFNHLEYAVETGESAFSQAFPGASDAYAYFRDSSPEEGKVFGQAMSSFSYSFDVPIINAYDFSSFETVLDVGGAEGRLLRMIKEKTPKVKATLFDQSFVIDQARTADKENQLEFVSGNFFEKIEPVSDCVILKYILHNWNDQDCITILKNCRKSLKPGGKLLIMEMLINDKDPQVFEKSLDIVLLTVWGAKERTKEEFEDLLTSTSFKLDKVIPTESPLCILELSAC